MGGHRVPGQGPNDDGYDEEGYDESQRAEILEATLDGPTDGTMLTDLAPDLGDADEDDDLRMTDDELGEEDPDAVTDADDDTEDEIQDDLDNDAISEEDLDEELDDKDEDSLEP